jgi:two-component system, response regulator PdtaR
VQQACNDAMASPIPHSILVVEDEVLVRMVIADDLLQAGFQVIQAATADEALKVFQSSIAIDLIVSDIDMPGTLDGLQLARVVRANWPATKILIYSGKNPIGLASIPVDAFLTKPCSPALLIDTVDHLLGIRNVRP